MFEDLNFIKVFNVILIKDQIPKNWNPYFCKNEKDIYDFNHECNKIFSLDYRKFQSDKEMIVFYHDLIKKITSKLEYEKYKDY